MVQKSRFSKNVLILGMGMIFAKISGFFRQAVLGYRFGTSEVSDAFLLTTYIPEAIFGAIIAAVSINYIPIYMTIGEQEKRDHFTSNLLTVSVIVVFFGIVCIEMIPRQLIRFFAFGLPEQTMLYAVDMLRINTLLLLPLIAWHILQAYSQSNNLFKTTAVVNNAMNVIVILAIIASNEETYFLPSVGNVLAHFVALIVVCLGLIGSGFYYHWIPDFKNPVIHVLCRLSIPLALEKIIWSMNLVVDRNLASSMGVGIISAMTYATLLANAVGVILLNPIATTVFPLFAKLAAEGKLKELSLAFCKYAKLLCFLLVPMSMFMIYFSSDIVTCILQHGAMNKESSKVISECLLFYAPGYILFWGLHDYFLRCIYALKGNWIAVKVRAISIACNIGFSVGLAQLFGYKGIVIATSISYGIAFLFLMYVLQRQYKIYVVSVIKNIIISLTYSAIALYFLLCHVEQYISANNNFLKIFGEGVIFLIIYIVVILIFHRRDTNKIMKDNV